MRPALSHVFFVLGCLGMMANIFWGKSDYTRVVDWGLPAACLIAGVVNFERTTGYRVPRLLAALGDSSYTLYLCHTFVLMVVGAFLKKGWLDALPIDLTILLSTAGCVFLGHLAYLVIERPVTRVLKEREPSLRRRTSAAPVP